MSLIEEALRKQRASGKPPRPLGEAQTARTSRSALPEGRLEQPGHERRTWGNLDRLRRLDREVLRAAGMLPPENEEHQLDQQFRNIKRPLIRKAFQEAPSGSGPCPRSIMVSSALPGDGKTFTSANLALSMALERDHSVILVDGDVAKPHISRLFDAAGEPGLLDVLQNPELGIESVILPTDITGLSIVPVGRQSEQATELLASSRMQTIIASLEALDPQLLVVVDSPPILLTSEARVLASLFGQVVIVVRAGITPQQAVLDALKHIGEGPQVNLVLNQALHVDDGSYGYGYGYGARYGDGGASGTEGPS